MNNTNKGNKQMVKPNGWEKIDKANKIVKEHVSKNYRKSSYAYIDFVLEDRFISEIMSDKNIDIQKLNSEELAEYAIEQIDKNARMVNLLGF